MHIELVLTGEELLDGRVVNTNLADISFHLNNRGYYVSRAVTVGDQPDLLVSTFRESIDRSDIVIVTGGLGPTKDDLTSETLSKVSGMELVKNDRAEQDIRRFFSKRNRPWYDNNLKQAYVPKGATLIRNNLGTAPGFSMKIGPCWVVTLPGVPDEMRPMLNDWVLPEIATKFPQKKVSTSIYFTTFGWGESKIQDALTDIYPLPKAVQLSFQVSFPQVRLLLSVVGDTESEAGKLLSQWGQKIKECLGSIILSEKGESLVEVFSSAMKKRHFSLSFAESCTGGMLSSLITDISGSSDFFKGALVSYSNDIKSGFLGVPDALLTSFGAVSSQVAEAMVRGVKKSFKTDVALSITGIAGPEGGSPEKPVGLVYVGAMIQDNCDVFEFRFSGNRDHIRRLACFHSLYNVLMKIR